MEQKIIQKAKTNNDKIQIIEQFLLKKKEQLKSEIKKNIFAWAKYYFPEKFTLPFCIELHSYFVEIMRDPFTSTLAPRGTAKTTIKCFLIPLYLALEFPEEYQHFLNVQSTTTKAEAINHSIKVECETNDRLIDDYGVFNEKLGKKILMGGKWTEKQFVLPNGVVFSCLGAGQSVRGINYLSKRPDYIIVDDLYDDDDMNNPNSIAKKESWFWGSLYPCRAAHKDCCVHIQGTAIHQTDLMHRLSNKPRWKFRKFQAIKNFDTKEVLWKENPAKTFDALMAEKEDMGTIIFEREMQNNCRDDDSAIIKQSYIKYYKHSELLQSGIKIRKVIAGLDPACGEKAMNDFSGYATIHISENYDVYIERATEAKNSFNANMNMIDSWNDRYDPDVFAIEGVSGFKMLTSEVRRTKNIKLREVDAEKDKITRLEAQSFRFENGKVHINSEMPQKDLDTIVYQLINNFPEHDDVRDAIIIAMEQIDTNKEVKVRRM